MIDIVMIGAVVFLTYLAGFYHGRISLRGMYIRELQENIQMRRQLMRWR